MTDYYARKLAGPRLRQVYDLASPRVRRYLEAEILHVRARLQPHDAVLELGCGYGRVTFRLAEVTPRVIGIDNARENIALARVLAVGRPRCAFLEMDAGALAFRDGAFDTTVCVQNGVCAFRIAPERLLREAIRVTRPGGRVLFSTYADAFWSDRLAWFRAQAAAGLLGAIDEAATGAGTIVCDDGFRASRLLPDDWRRLAAHLGCEHGLAEVDGSSLFCEFTVGVPRRDEPGGGVP